MRKLNSAASKLTLILGMIALAPAAQAAGGKASDNIRSVLSKGSLEAGSFSGTVANDKKTSVTLSIQPIKEREGSFLGFLFTLPSNAKLSDPRSAQAAIYIIDPLESGNYMMIPVTTGMSSVGIFNDNPSLSLTLSSDKMLINPTSERNNSAGFQGSMILTHDSLIRLTEGVDGRYGLKPATNKIVDPEMSVGGGINSVAANISIDSNSVVRGKFASRMILPYLYILKGKKVSVYGEEEALDPEAVMGFFDIVHPKKGTVISSHSVVMKLSNQGPSTAIISPRR